MRSIYEVLFRAAISDQEALEIAKDFSDAMGLPWLLPVRIRRSFRDYVIWTHADKIGGNVEIRVHARTGQPRRTFGPLSR